MNQLIERANQYNNGLISANEFLHMVIGDISDVTQGSLDQTDASEALANALVAKLTA
jgi:hypothetical protein